MDIVGIDISVEPRGSPDMHWLWRGLGHHLLAELPNVEPRGSPDIADFTPKALAAFVGLSPRPYSAGFAGGTLTTSAQRA